MISEVDVRASLNEIIDPCSTAAGCSAGLDEMGLVRAVEVCETASGTDIRVVIGVTEYGCLMGAPFANEAYRRLQALPGVGAITVELDGEFDWDRDDMRADYQKRLKHHRIGRGLLRIPVVVTSSESRSDSNVSEDVSR